MTSKSFLSITTLAEDQDESHLDINKVVLRL